MVATVVQRADFQFAAVARAGIDVADGKRAAELTEDYALKARREMHCFVCCGRRLRLDAVTTICLCATHISSW